MTEGKSPLPRSAIVIAAVAAYCGIALLVQPPLFWVVDLPAWVHDWTHFSACLDRGEACDSASRFPTGYLLNSFVLVQAGWRGVKPKQTVLVLNLLFLSLPIVLMLASRGLRYTLRAGPIYCVALLASPIPAFYVNSGALEVQSGVVMGVFLSAVILGSGSPAARSRPALRGFVLVSGLLFPWYKDTNVPVVLATLTLALVATRLPLWKRVGGGAAFAPGRDASGWAAAAVGASLLTIAFVNHAKYGSVFPTEYLEIRTLTAPPLSKSVEFLVGSTFSPAGGIVVFWSAALALTVLLFRLSSLRFSGVAVLASCLLSAGFLAGNSLWFVSFGWFSWGNRFMVPSLLVCLICLTTTATMAGEHAAVELAPGAARRPFDFGRLRGRPLALLSAAGVAVCCLASLYYVHVSYYGDRWDGFWSALHAGPRCARMEQALAGELGKRLGLEFWKTDLYYACARERFLHPP